MSYGNYKFSKHQLVMWDPQYAGMTGNMNVAIGRIVCPATADLPVMGRLWIVEVGFEWDAKYPFTCFSIQESMLTAAEEGRRDDLVYDYIKNSPCRCSWCKANDTL